MKNFLFKIGGLEFNLHIFNWPKIKNKLIFIFDIRISIFNWVIGLSENTQIN